MDEVKRFVGIDVAKLKLDVFIGSTGERFTVANGELGIRVLLRQLVPADFGFLRRPAASRGKSQVRWRPPDSAWRSSIRAKCATLPAPPAGWPRPTRLTPKYWRVSVKRSDHRRGPWPTNRGRHSKHWLPVGASWSRC